MDAIQNAKEKDTTWLEDAKWRHANADWLDLSAAIAIKILRFLREHKITQKELADRLGFSPQYVSKIVKGSENLTLETICKIQKALGIKLIEVPDLLLNFEKEQPLIEDDAHIDVPIEHQQTQYTNKIFNVGCHNCKVKFTIRVTLKKSTRSGKSDLESVTKVCPSCGHENKFNLPPAV